MRAGSPGRWLRTATALVAVGAAAAGCALVALPPVADFDVMPVVLYAGEEVALDASASTGDLVSYEWSLGSGVSESGVEVTTRFGSPGVYPIRLTVTDAAGRSATAAAELIVYVRAGTEIFSEDFSDGAAALGRWALDPSLSSADEGGMDYISSDGVGYCLFVHSEADRLHRRGAAVEVPPLRVGQKLVFSFDVMATKIHAGYGFIIAPCRTQLALPAAGLPYFVYSGTSGGATIHEPSPDGTDAVLPVSFRPSVYQWHTYVLTYEADHCYVAVDGDVHYAGALEDDLSSGGSWWIVVGDESEADACSTYYGRMRATVEE